MHACIDSIWKNMVPYYIYHCVVGELNEAKSNKILKLIFPAAIKLNMNKIFICEVKLWDSMSSVESDSKSERKISKLL